MVRNACGTTIEVPLGWALMERGTAVGVRRAENMQRDCLSITQRVKVVEPIIVRTVDKTRLKMPQVDGILKIWTRISLAKKSTINSGLGVWCELERKKGGRYGLSRWLDNLTVPHLVTASMQFEHSSTAFDMLTLFF
jgi:hypothetical protein